MSADNGIYILESEGEFRVIEAMAIDNIDYEPDALGFNTQALKDYFGRAQIYYDRQAALNRANEMYQEIINKGWFLEYGISFIKYPGKFPK